MKFFIIVLMFLIIVPISQAQTRTDSEKIDDIRETTLDISNVADQIKRQTTMSISVGATEYSPGDEALIHVKVLESGLPVDDATCDAIIFYPNLTILTQITLDKVLSSRGIYAKNLTAPSEEGIYIVDVSCVRPLNSTSTRYYLRGANLANDLFFKNTSGDVFTGVDILNVDPNGELDCYPDKFSTSPSDFPDEFPPLGLVQNISDNFIYVNRNGTGSPRFDVILRFWKETEFGEIHLDSVVNDTVLPATIKKVLLPTADINSNFKSGESLELELCISSVNATDSDDISFLFNSSTGLFGFNSSFVVNSIDTNQSLDFITGGSSEMNVRSLANISASVNETSIAMAVWNYSTRTLTAFNFLVNLTSSAIGDIWNFGTRTLTGFGFLVDAQVNQSSIAESVWNFSNRTLSEPITINATNLTINATIDPATVWNYPNRTLSTYCQGIGGDVIGRCVWEFFWQAGSVT